MANRSGDWRRQAEADLRHARQAREAGSFDWACFAAHEAADKAMKAALLARGTEAWGHSVTRLLDRHYIPTRYPDNLPDGAPTDFYGRADADDAIAAAEVVLAHGGR